MSFDEVLAELVAVSRRAGLLASPVEAMDVQRAAMAVGLERRDDLRDALRAVLVKDPEDLPIFERTFDAFFRVGSEAPGGARSVLAGEGATDEELEALERAIAAQQQAEGGGSAAALAALMQGGSALDELLRDAAAGVGVDRIRNPMQIGLFTMRVLDAAGAPDLPRQLDRLRQDLRGELGERADELVDRLAAETQRLRAAARARVDEELGRQSAGYREELRRRMLHERSFTQLSPEEVRQVRREVQKLAQRLKGRLAVRTKRRRRGQLDLRRTLRRSWRTGGLPFRPVFRRRPPDRPRLVLLCDVSESVRFAARFLLILVHAVQDAFTRTRTFVFVSDLGESTDLFSRHPVEEAIDLAYGGAVIRVASNSDYGRALGTFDDDFARAVDRRTTVVILGDGRTNYLDPRADALQSVQRRAARVLWLNPEPRSSWGFGDSAMDAYLPHVDEAHTVHNLDTLRIAVERLLRA